MKTKLDVLKSAANQPPITYAQAITSVQGIGTVFAKTSLGDGDSWSVELVIACLYDFTTNSASEFFKLSPQNQATIKNDFFKVSNDWQPVWLDPTQYQAEQPSLLKHANTLYNDLKKLQPGQKAA